VIVRGRDARLFWLGSVAPVVLALILGAVAWNDALVWAAGLAGLLVQPALLVHETAFVRAGQDFIDHPLVRVPRTSAPPSPAAGCAVLARRRGSLEIRRRLPLYNRNFHYRFLAARLRALLIAGASQLLRREVESAISFAEAATQQLHQPTTPKFRGLV